MKYLMCSITVSPSSNIHSNCIISCSNDTFEALNQQQKQRSLHEGPSRQWTVSTDRMQDHLCLTFTRVETKTESVLRACSRAPLKQQLGTFHKRMPTVVLYRPGCTGDRWYRWLKKVSCSSKSNCPKILKHMLPETINSLLCECAPLGVVYCNVEPLEKLTVWQIIWMFLQFINWEIGFSVLEIL